MTIGVIDTMSFLKLAFSDYVAARVLISKGEVFNGMILASTSVEKYLKALLAIKGVKKPVHLSEFDKLKQLLSVNDIIVLNNLDEKFIRLLGTIYNFRYYDNTKKDVDGVGFLVNQVLGELDCTVNHIETLITITSKIGQVWNSPYKLAVQATDIRVMDNNYLLNGVNKVEYMSRDSLAFVCVVRDKEVIQDFLPQLIKPTNGYSGSVLILDNFRKDP
jgi:HEPN domain-containing protein